MKSVNHNSISLKQLKQKFEDQVFAIPELQRNYVWEAARVCKLMDSIYHQYPIGVALVWKARSGKNVEIRPNHKTIIPAFNLNNSFVEFIIDGQQRLSSIYGVLYGLTSDGTKTKTDFSRIFFDLRKNDKLRFVYSNRLSQNSQDYIKLFELLSSAPSNLQRKYKLNQKQFKELKLCRDRFDRYKVHFLTIETESLEEVRETFIRINSEGMTVKKADTLFAKTTKIGLKDLVENTRRSLQKNGFCKIEPKYFIYTLALANGETRISGTALEAFHKKFENKNIGKKEFANTWKRFHNSFTITADFLLQDYGVTQIDLLPSSNIFTLLSFFHYINGNKRPTSVQKKEIKRWFWHTVIAERYSGRGFNINVPRDVEFFKRLARSRAVYSIDEKVNVWDFLRADYRKIKTSTAVSGYFLYLRSKQPRYLENGELMLLDGASSIANRKDRHHIFPQNLLRSREVNMKWIHSIGNICLLAANENQSISDNHPRDYLLDYKKAKHFGRVVNSHFIPCGPNDGVWNSNVKDGFRIFLNERAKALIRAMERDLLSTKGRLFETFQPLSRI